MAKKHIVGIATLALVLAACGGDDSSENSDTSSGDGTISGDLTVLTHRTDIVDTVLEDYKSRFQEKYPDVDITFEAITEYEGDVSIRLNTEEYGDVLMIPAAVTRDQLPEYFEPLGTVEELGEKYRFVQEQSYQGDVYGISITGNANGYVFNKRVWEEAGITEPPASPEEFIDALRAIEENTDAIPYYTNYGDGWPLGQIRGNMGVLTGSEVEIDMAHMDEPWTEGQDIHLIDSLVYDIVAEGLTEDDPTTTNWEESKNLLGTGEIATMFLGSWAVTQMQDAAENVGASRDDIGYWPFPSQTDGTFRVRIGGDYKMGINKHSEHKEAARAWIDWYTEESGYATSEGGLSVTVGGELPDTLQDFEPLDIEFFELTPPPEGEETLYSDIFKTAEIDLDGWLYNQEMIDIARGAADGDKESYFSELNQRWSDARAQVAG
ncbi:ABC transporter substrate-binding protein [Phytoactinopolyspora halotolerans]|uniref:Carbohydrate ABC transporter substrate-binding protein n=1 Tax=Phytoactinopolyspora halotolerans TaxID=1981512 RepID=A0A6L9S6A4_9ACTN|nr:ABC transporter substrate-binding protein [Phytoactinopolyspora halotolerans]NEE00686.1 carbohydrate ABC transporter substrate-binding protein [Phytoactinopolyspora halotolerans]